MPNTNMRKIKKKHLVLQEKKKKEVQMDGST